MIDAERLLVIAPHPDDDVLGCGGTIALATERGADVHVLVIFDGAAGDPNGKFDAADYVQRRQREARAAGKHLGVTRYTFWDMPEGHLAQEQDLQAGAARLAALVEDWRPDAIFAPWIGDGHRDHQSVARAVQRMLREHAVRTPVWGFEVWSPLDAQHLVDISSVWPAKLDAIGMHRTQLAYDDLLQKTTKMAQRHAVGLLEAFRRYEVQA